VPVAAAPIWQATCGIMPMGISFPFTEFLIFAVFIIPLPDLFKDYSSIKIKAKVEVFLYLLRCMLSTLHSLSAPFV
jgi:hypothetical protein